MDIRLASSIKMLEIMMEGGIDVTLSIGDFFTNSTDYDWKQDEQELPIHVLVNNSRIGCVYLNMRGTGFKYQCPDEYFTYEQGSTIYQKFSMGLTRALDIFLKENYQVRLYAPRDMGDPKLNYYGEYPALNGFRLFSRSDYLKNLGTWINDPNILDNLPSDEFMKNFVGWDEKSGCIVNITVDFNVLLAAFM